MILLLARCTGRTGGLSPKVRMGFGLILSCLAMAVSAITESRRRGVAIEQGFEDDPNAVVDMSAMWLVPQFALLGVAEAFYSIGQIEFFYNQFPKTMSSIAVALATLGMAVSSLMGSFLVNIVNATTKGGNVSWLSSNLNRGHVDYYYWLIAFLGLLNFFYFLICCRAYEEPIKKETSRFSGKVDEEGSDYRELPSA